MKKIFEFEENTDTYILKNTNPNYVLEPFIINKNQMEFDSNLFYKYVFSDIAEEMDIQILDKTNDDNKEAKRIYSIIQEVTNGVMCRINDKCFK